MSTTSLSITDYILYIGSEQTFSVITSQPYRFQFSGTVNYMDFKFFSHKLCTKMQNAFLRHFHEEIFLLQTINVKISSNTKMRLGVLAPEPRSRVMAYFLICWSKYRILFMHVLKMNVLHVFTLHGRAKLEIRLIYGGSKLKTIKL